MPTVPTYSQPQVRARATPNVRQDIRVPAGAFGESAARGLIQAGQQVDRAGNELFEHALKMKRENDVTAVKEAENAFLQARRALTVEGDDAFYNQRGRAAVDGYEPFSSALAGMAEKYGSNLSNDDQKRMWQDVSSRHINSELDTAARHAAAQRRVWQTETSEARVGTAVSEAVGARSQAERDAARATVMEEIQAQAELNGWSADVTEYKRLGALTTMHVGVVDRLLANGNPGAAADYYKNHKDEISGDRQADIEQSLQTGSIRAAGQSRADEIMASGGSPTEMLKQARAIKDPKLRDEVVDRVRGRINEQESLRRVEESRFLDSVAQRVAERGLGAVTPSEEVRLRGLGKWDAVRAVANPDEVVTNWGAWAELRTMTDDKLKDVNPLEYRHQLADAEFKQLTDMVRDARNGDPDGSNTRVRSVNQMVDDTLRVLDIDPSPKEGTGDAERSETFRRSVQGRLASFEALEGRKAKPQEIQQIIDRAAMEVTTDDGTLWDTTKRRYEMTIDDVPDAERQQIVDAIRANPDGAARLLGYPVTEITEQVVLDLFALANQTQE